MIVSIFVPTATDWSKVAALRWWLPTPRPQLPRTLSSLGKPLTSLGLVFTLTSGWQPVGLAAESRGKPAQTAANGRQRRCTPGRGCPSRDQAGPSNHGPPCSASRSMGSASRPQK